MAHSDHLSSERHLHGAIAPPSSSISGSTPPVLLFDTYLQEFKDPITPFDIQISWNDNWYVAACPGSTGRRCIGCGGYGCHLDQIIVGIDGACRNNGLPNAEASIGVVFGPRSDYNLSERVITEPFTNQRAELIAAYRALQQVGMFRSYESVSEKDSHPIDSVVIKSDSAYVVNGLTEWVWKWETNRYRTSQGTSVVNADLFKILVKKISELKEMGIQLYFWQVPRKYNEEADELANRALDHLY